MRQKRDNKDISEEPDTWWFKYVDRIKNVFGKIIKRKEGGSRNGR